MEDLDSATLDDVREWFKTYLHAIECGAGVGGDITVVESS